MGKKRNHFKPSERQKNIKKYIRMERKRERKRKRKNKYAHNL